MTPAPETVVSFPCFGSTARVYVGGSGLDGRPAELAALVVKRQLLGIHKRLSRFSGLSELSRLNADRRATVPASAALRALARAAVQAGRQSDGLVDATLLEEIERAGYAASREGQDGLGTAGALRSVTRRRPARAGLGRWREIHVDDDAGTISRPPGLRLDSGGIGKGLAADLAACAVDDHACFAIDCAGDLRIGGTAGVGREVVVDDPFGGDPLAHLEVVSGGVATSGVGRRTWLSADGRAAHHLLDPATGEPAYTGVAQVTALAPTALEAEIRAKAALLAGPDELARWLPDGGVAVLDDRTVEHVSTRAPRGEIALT